MSSLDRRAFLKQTAATCSALKYSPLFAQTRVGQQVYPNATLLFGFVDPLPVPKHLAPAERHKSRTVYHVHMKEGMHAMHSSLPPTKVWGYEGLYPGPTIEAFQGERVEVIWENSLPQNHLFKIDPHIHGAMPPAPTVRSVPHLHGSRTSSES